MRIGLRFSLIYSGILGLLILLALWDLNEDLKPRYREGIEETLVDLSQTLSTIYGGSSSTNEDFYSQILASRELKFRANIYGFDKSKTDILIYITDESGKVLFHSHDSSAVGKDFSQWRDVYLTLRGEYGSRTTRDRQDDENSTVLYVAAPVIKNGKIDGTLTVGKPQENVHRFIYRARDRIILWVAIGFLFIFSLGILLSRVISSPIDRLIQFTAKVSQGDNPLVPRFGLNELDDLAQSVERMRRDLQGKAYIEEYIQILTHELKSPTAGIQAAAELLLEEMPEENRNKFLGNILSESARLDEIITRLLELASLEHASEIERNEIVEVNQLIDESIEPLSQIAAEKNIYINRRGAAFGKIKGDALLLRHSLSNLIKNAIEFSPKSSIVEVVLEELAMDFKISIKDEGSGIPEYALNRIGEKFYSLPRPDSGRKGTGLGIALVKRVVALHMGSFSIISLNQAGALASIQLPKYQG